MLSMSSSYAREAFSINLNEDYEIYGIDPNEDLDDWSFLNQKPEPIPEKTEEEKRLFEQLLAPSITDEEIQSEIHDRLKSLLVETDQFLQNDVKVELLVPIEVKPEEIKSLVDENSFEYKQADKVSTLVKDLLNTTNKSEDMDDFIKSLTKSDELAEKIAKEVEDENLSKSINQNTTEIQNNETNNFESESEVPPPTKVDIDIDNNKNTQKSFLSRYVRKPGTKDTIIRDQDETERLSSKFLLDRKKRQEEAEAELKRKQEEMEKKEKEFFESLQKEAEKHKREVQMIKEMKENHNPTFSEMLNNIQKKPTQNEQETTIPKAALKPKPKPKPVKEPRMSDEKIYDFYIKREKKMKETLKKPPQQVLVIDLKTNNEGQMQRASHHTSKKYKNTLISKIGEVLVPKIKEKLNENENQSKDESNKLKIAIFFRMAHQLKYHRLQKQCEKTVIVKSYLKKWRQKRLFSSLTKFLSALKIQRAFKKFLIISKAKEAQKRAQEANDLAIKEMESNKHEISDEQILDRTRNLIEKAQKGNKENEGNKKKKILNFAATLPSFPELPEIDDLDWFDDINLSDIENFSDDDDFLSTLPDSLQTDQPIQIHELPNTKVESPRREKPFKSPRSSVVAESESIPLEANEYDYLAGFNQHIDLNDNQENREETTTTNNNNNNAVVNNNVNQFNPQPPGANEGYHFENPRTAAMMEAMQKRRANVANKNVKENPMDKFQRLYGKKKNTPPPLQGQNQQRPFLSVVRRSEFKKNSAREQRLLKLKKVWLEGP